MEYVVESGTKYVLNYPELKEDYLRYKAMTDVEFVENLIPALHFVCVVSYFKGTPGYVMFNDEGLIHQMVHLLDAKTRPQYCRSSRRYGSSSTCGARWREGGGVG